MKIAVFQMDIAFGDPEANRAKVKQKLEEIADRRPDVIVLPELWTTGYDLARLNEIADPDGHTLLTEAGEWARRHRVNLVAGSVAVKTERGVTNTLYAFDREGHCIGRYSKVHLFRLMEEDRHLLPGAEAGLFSLDGIPCAGLICYDIRFPEWVRKHTLAGARILFVPAEWPHPRLAHWRTLLTARAIENQCFVVACNRAGSDPNNHFAGHSLILDPWGEILAEAGEKETVLWGEIDPGLVEEVRTRIPVFEDRRPDLYQDLSGKTRLQ
jgi:predicted amidohydrolase